MIAPCCLKKLGKPLLITDKPRDAVVAGIMMHTRMQKKGLPSCLNLRFTTMGVGLIGRSIALNADKH